MWPLVWGLLIDSGPVGRVSWVRAVRSDCVVRLRVYPAEFWSEQDVGVGEQWCQFGSLMSYVVRKPEEGGGRGGNRLVYKCTSETCMNCSRERNNKRFQHNLISFKGVP